MATQGARAASAKTTDVEVVLVEELLGRSGRRPILWVVELKQSSTRLTCDLACADDILILTNTKDLAASLVHAHGIKCVLTGRHQIRKR